MFTVQSTKFLPNLRGMRERFKGINQFSYKIVVPPEMIWWYWQEFGTALYAERGTKPGNEVGYDVTPINKGALKFYDRGAGDFRIAAKTFVYGIPPHHMVTDSLPEIEIEMKQSVMQAFREAEYDANKIHEILLTKMMPRIKEIIRQAFEIKLNLPSRPNGKLDQSAADEFEQKAEVKDNTFDSTQ
jgi:hypothetical protein